MPLPPDVAPGVREAFDHWLWNHDTATRDAITSAASQELKTWLATHADDLTAAIANEVTTRVLKTRSARQSVVPGITPCPACSAESSYSRELDRYVHYDGSDNRACWLAISRGEVNASEAAWRAEEAHSRHQVERARKASSPAGGTTRSASGGPRPPLPHGPIRLANG